MGVLKETLNGFPEQDKFFSGMATPALPATSGVTPINDGIGELVQLVGGQGRTVQYVPEAPTVVLGYVDNLPSSTISEWNTDASCIVKLLKKSRPILVPFTGTFTAGTENLLFPWTYSVPAKVAFTSPITSVTSPASFQSGVNLTTAGTGATDIFRLIRVVTNGLAANSDGFITGQNATDKTCIVEYVGPAQA